MTATRRVPALAWVGGGLLALVVLAAVAAPWLAPYDPALRSGPPFASPGAGHWLGTNDVGQDILSEVIYGARVSLAVGLAAAAAATLVGSLVGIASGYAGGWVDTVLMRVVDATLALPFLPLVIVAGVFLGGGMGTQVAVIAAIAWAVPARELRPQVMTVRHRADVEAARVMGAGTGYLLRRHLFPAIAPLLPPQLVRAANLAILTQASLSFLGLGQAGHPSWGNMLYYAQVRGAMLTDAWRWWVLPPGLCIAATVIALALIGFTIEDRVDPRLGTAQAARRRRPGRSPACSPDPAAPALLIEGLTAGYPTESSSRSLRPVLSQVDLQVNRGEIVGLVGRSGSGKSTLAAAVMGQLRSPGHIASGTVRVAGCDINALGEPARRSLRGRVVALVPQDAMGALNPVVRVGDQIAEAVRVHCPVSKAVARQEAERLLKMVDLPAGRARSLPHEFSGGMRQRAVLAMALAHRPALLVADEPTTGLDPVVRYRLLELLEKLHRELGMAVLLISHDLDAVMQLAGRVVVLEEGRVVESASPAELALEARHPATRRLLASRLPADPPPASGPEGGDEPAAAVLRLEQVDKRFGRGRQAVVAADGVDLQVRPGEAVGLVGRSGAGKSTVARLVCGLDRPDGGRIVVDGVDVTRLRHRRRRRACRGVHLVFQDPYEALPANLQVLQIVAEPLTIRRSLTRAERNRAAREALEDVALDPDRFSSRFPHELSGGERQRVALARAVVGRPALVIADEPAAMLDTVLAAELAGLIAQLRLRHRMAWLLITHELALAARVCDRLVVMGDGRVQDEGPARELLAAPSSPAASELVTATRNYRVGHEERGVKSNV